MRRSFLTITRVTTALVAGAVVTLVAAYAVLLVAGYKPVAVYSGSMRPTLAYRTKGDANAARDPWAVRLTGHVGRVAFHVPLAGYLLYYAHTREVRGALTAIIAALLLLAILRRIWRTEAAKEARA